MYSAIIKRQFKTSNELLWDALTNPEKVKKYFFGTHLEADWKIGGAITFTGEWNGQTYVDKGIIKELEIHRKLKYSYLSSFSGKEDLPENYADISYELSVIPTGTELTIIQEGIDSEERKTESEGNWNFILDELEKLIL